MPAAARAQPRCSRAGGVYLHNLTASCSGLQSVRKNSIRQAAGAVQLVQQVDGSRAQTSHTLQRARQRGDSASSVASWRQQPMFSGFEMPDRLEVSGPHLLALDQTLARLMTSTTVSANFAESLALQMATERDNVGQVQDVLRAMVDDSCGINMGDMQHASMHQG